MKTFFLIPNPGTVIKDPRTGRRIPEAGTEVPDDAYFRRRVREGAGKIGKSPRPSSPRTLSTSHGKKTDQ